MKPIAVRSLIVALLTFSLLAVEAPAAEIAYYRFESSPGFLNDSSGNGNTLTTVGTVNPATLPSGLRGAAFPNPIPRSFAPNLQAADTPGSGNYLRSAAGLSSVPTSAFTIEAFVHWENTAHSNESFADMIAAT